MRVVKNFDRHTISIRGVRLRRTTLVASRRGACPLLLRISLLAFLGLPLSHSLRNELRRNRGRA